jgi:hypothetical protein
VGGARARSRVVGIQPTAERQAGGSPSPPHQTAGPPNGEGRGYSRWDFYAPFVLDQPAHQGAGFHPHSPVCDALCESEFTYTATHTATHTRQYISPRPAQGGPSAAMLGEMRETTLLPVCVVGRQRLTALMDGGW